MSALNDAVDALNEYMKGHSQYAIRVSPRGFYRLVIIEGKGATKDRLHLGNDEKKAAETVAAILEWEESA